MKVNQDFCWEDLQYQVVPLPEDIPLDIIYEDDKSYLANIDGVIGWIHK